MPILPDLLRPGLSIVFCGMAPSPESARQRAYYAGPGNRFWITLFEVGLTPRLLAPAEFRLLPQWGLGLTDVNKTESGRDAALSRDAFDPDALRAKIETYQPRFLATTGKASGRHVLGRPCDYGLQPETIGATRIFVLPSTSGAARGHWSIEPWRALANAART